jgi:hypothetical protein
VKVATGTPVLRSTAVPAVFAEEMSEAERLPKLEPIRAVPPVFERLKPRSVLPCASVRLLALP